MACYDTALQYASHHGIADDYPIMRHGMILEPVKTYEGTHGIHRLINGQSLTGVPAYG
jgi:glutaryl-CoA dehydrogenase